MTRAPPRGMNWFNASRMGALGLTQVSRAEPAPGRPAPSSPPQVPPSPPPSAPRPATTGLNGLWEGEFRCGREARTARMMIWREGSHHAASFEFGPTAASPNLAHGALQMRGATTTDGRVRFEPEGTASLAPGDRPIGLLAWVEGPDLRAEVTNRAACAPVSLRKARS